MQYHAFISYSRKDIGMMRRLRDRLSAEGLIVWTDENLTPGTQSWKMAIEDAIENSRCLVILLSPDAKESEWVGRELDYAITQGLRIFPVLVRGSERNAIPFTLISMQWSDVRQDYEIGTQALLTAIFSHLKLPRATPRLDPSMPHSVSPRPGRRTGGLVIGALLLIVLIAVVVFMLPALQPSNPPERTTPTQEIFAATEIPTQITLIAADHTPTATDDPVSTPTPLPTYVEGERVLGPDCTVMLEDEFENGNSPNDWFEGVGNSSRVQIRDDFYEVYIDSTAPEDSISWGSLRGIQFGDARIEAVISASRFSTPPARSGLWLRYQDENNFITFTINSTGAFRIARYQSGYTTLVDWTRTDSVRIGDGVTNTVRIDSEGNRFNFFINGERVATVDDNTWDEGRIAFFGSTNQAPNNFYLDYLRVCEP